jgi:hypothetical protein
MISAKPRDLDIYFDPSLPAWRTARIFTALEKMDPTQMKHIYSMSERKNSEEEGKSSISLLLNSEHKNTQNISCEIEPMPPSFRRRAASDWDLMSTAPVLPQLASSD